MNVDMRLKRWVCIALGCLPLLPGCKGTTGSGTYGELGAGTFNYVCINPGDAVCSGNNAIDSFLVRRDLGRSGAIPDAIAVGSVFSLDYEGGSFENDIDRIVAAHRGDELGAEEFSIEQPAEASFLAVKNFDEVEDFVVVVAKEAVVLKIWVDEATPEHVQMQVGETLDVTVASMDEDEHLLGGALPYAWQSMNARVLGLTAPSNTHVVDALRNEGDVVLHAKELGASVVRVSSGDLGAELFVEVKP